MQKGFIHIPIIALVVLLGIGGFVYIKTSQPQTPVASSTMSPEPTESPTPTPTLKPTLSPKPKATATPKPSSTPTSSPQASTPCSKFKPEDGLATITVTIQPKSGETLVGDAGVTLKSGGSCPGQVPGGGSMTAIIKQGTTSWTSPGLAPGTFRIDVNYHGNGTGNDVDAVSGGNSLTVTVSN